MESFGVSPMACDVFNEARLLGEHTDLTIRANGTEFKVHKIILCACSPYFRVLFSKKWTDADEQTYDIQGIPPNILSVIIEFAYTRSALITEENVFELLVTADHLLVSGLLGACSQFLENHLCPETCTSIFKITKDFYSCKNIHQKAKQYMLLHFEEILRVSKDFLELSLDELQEIIGDDQLNVRHEELVFEAILHWIDHDQESRRKDIAVLLPKVRLGLMTVHYFINNVEQNALVVENEACKPVIYSAMKALFDFQFYGPMSPELLHQLTRPRLPSTILLAIGGWSSGPTNAIEVFDVRTELWVSLNAVDERPRAYLGTAVLKEFVYCIGGYDSVGYFNSVRKFNLITQTWHEVAPMHERRCYVSATVLDGFIYAIGGFDGLVRLRSAEYYHPNTNQWTLTAQMNECRSDASATSLQGKVYICGGFTGTECLFSAEMFNPQSNQWTLIASMGSRRSGVGVIAYRDLIYAVGGFDGVSRLASVEVYNPRRNIWRDVASMNHTRSNFGIEVVDDQLFAVGGFHGSGTIPNVECYDVEMEEWYTVNEMSLTRSALSCCVASGLPNIIQYVAQRDAIQIQDESDSE